VHARHDKTIAMRDHWNIKSGDHTQSANDWWN
jgi:hypothetical protein